MNATEQAAEAMKALALARARHRSALNSANETLAKIDAVNERLRQLDQSAAVTADDLILSENLKRELKQLTHQKSVDAQEQLDALRSIDRAQVVFNKAEAIAKRHAIEAESEKLIAEALQDNEKWASKLNEHYANMRKCIDAERRTRADAGANQDIFIERTTLMSRYERNLSGVGEALKAHVRSARYRGEVEQQSRSAELRWKRETETKRTEEPKVEMTATGPTHYLGNLADFKSMLEESTDEEQMQTEA